MWVGQGTWLKPSTTTTDSIIDWSRIFNTFQTWLALNLNLNFTMGFYLNIQGIKELDEKFHVFWHLSFLCIRRIYKIWRLHATSLLFLWFAFFLMVFIFSPFPRCTCVRLNLKRTIAMLVNHRGYQLSCPDTIMGAGLTFCCPYRPKKN